MVRFQAFASCPSSLLAIHRLLQPLQSGCKMKWCRRNLQPPLLPQFLRSSVGIIYFQLQELHLQPHIIHHRYSTMQESMLEHDTRYPEHRSSLHRPSSAASSSYSHHEDGQPAAETTRQTSPAEHSPIAAEFLALTKTIGSSNPKFEQTSQTPAVEPRGQASPPSPSKRVPAPPAVPAKMGSISRAAISSVRYHADTATLERLTPRKTPQGPLDSGTGSPLVSLASALNSPPRLNSTVLRVEEADGNRTSEGKRKRMRRWFTALAMRRGGAQE
jgi:hypothetical protein